MIRNKICFKQKYNHPSIFISLLSFSYRGGANYVLRGKKGRTQGEHKEITGEFLFSNPN